MIYLDTSILVAFLANEKTAPAIQTWYAADADHILVTSDWSLTEFSSAICLKERTQQLTNKQATTIHTTFNAFIEEGVRLLEVSRHAFRQSANLIRSMPGLRSGDALHLAVALESGIQHFATLDKRRAEKAVQLNFSLITF